MRYILDALNKKIKIFGNKKAAIIKYLEDSDYLKIASDEKSKPSYDIYHLCQTLVLQR